MRPRIVPHPPEPPEHPAARPLRLRAGVLALGLACLVAAGLPSSAPARPPGLLWQAGAGPEDAPAWAVLLLERDATSVRLLSSRVVAGPLKLRPRAPAPGGLSFQVRDAKGAVLLVGQTFDARLEAHGDEPDPATGTLRSISVILERIAFPLRIPLVPGAHDVAIHEPSGGGAAPLVDELRGAAPGVLLGVIRLPGDAR